jgi:hypothetical protein
MRGGACLLLKYCSSSCWGYLVVSINVITSCTASSLVLGSLFNTGKLNGKRPLTTQKEQKADYGASTCHQSVDMQQIQQMFEKMYEEKRKNEEQASFGIASQDC